MWTGFWKALSYSPRHTSTWCSWTLTCQIAPGLDTLRRVLEHSPAVPTVVLTGTDGMEQALQAVREGAADYLFKGRMDGPLLSRAIRFAIRTGAHVGGPSPASRRRKCAIARFSRNRLTESSCLTWRRACRSSSTTVSATTRATLARNLGNFAFVITNPARPLGRSRHV